MASGPITSWQIDRETMETVTDLIFLSSKITADDDCSHETQRCLLLGRKAMTNIDSIFKSRDVTLPTKVHLVSSVQLLSRVQLFVTLWTAARQASLSITNSRSSPKRMSTESVMLSNHLILCHPLLLLPSIFPSIRVFSDKSALFIRWSKYWSFSISTFTEYSGLIFFRIDWFNLLAVQGTLKSLLQHHSSKASILRRSSQSNSHIHT